MTTVSNDTRYQLKSQTPGQRGPIPPAFKAMQFAAAGVIVHELNGKIPVADGWNTCTVAPSTADIRKWRWGCNYGVLTGSRNRNLAVIDLDTSDAIKEFEKNFSHLIDTYTVKTRRGVHKYYYVDDLPTTTKIPGKIELMADDLDGQGGKNVVGEGSVHESGHVYTGNGKKIMRVSSLADVAAYIESQKPTRETKIRNFPNSKRFGISGDLTRYYAKILSEETAAIASAPDGAGNDTVYRCALKLFGAVDEGGIPESVARAEIAGALAGWTYRNSGDKAAIERTIESAWQGRAGGRNGRKPQLLPMLAKREPLVPEIAPESGITDKSATVAETVQNLHSWDTMPDAILSSMLRTVPTIAPLARIIVKSKLRVFNREQMQAVASDAGMSKGTFDRAWPSLISPQFALLECISSAYIDSKSANYRLLPCIGVIEQLRPLDEKWVDRVCFPTGAPPEPGYEDRRIVKPPTAEMIRDSGIDEDTDHIAAELRSKMQPAFEAQGYAEQRALAKAKWAKEQIKASYSDPYETAIPDDMETHTLATLRTSLLNAYVSEHPGETLSRFKMRMLLGVVDSSIKAVTMRAGVKGETPAELPALDIRAAADIDRIIPYQGQVKGYPIQVTYTQDGETVTRGIDARKDAQGMRRVCEMALNSGAASIKVLYQTAKEYHVESAPLPTKERVIREVGEGDAPISGFDMSNPETPESEPSDPRKYPRRWLVGQYQLALERMGWKRAPGGVLLVNPATHETAPDNPRELIELILGRSLTTIVDTDPDFYTRESTEYELNARHDFRMEMIEQGWRIVT